MEAVIGPIILGVILIILGAGNMRGNLSSIHRYHRRRISERDKKPFGRLVGLGTLIIGAAVALFGGLTFAAEKTECEAFAVAGRIEIIVSICIGVGISLYAMLKYNKGVF